MVGKEISLLIQKNQVIAEWARKYEELEKENFLLKRKIIDANDAKVNKIMEGIER